MKKPFVLFNKTLVICLFILLIGICIHPAFAVNLAINKTEQQFEKKFLITTNPGIQRIETFMKTFGGTHYDSGLCGQQTTDNGYIITGFTRSLDYGNYDIWLIKTDSTGNMEWNKTFGGKNGDIGWYVQQTTDGGYIIMGDTNYSYIYGADVWLIKTDSAGNMEWNRTFGGIDDDWSYSGQQTTDGGYIIIGSTRSFSAGAQDVWLIKTDSTGIEEWNLTFGGTYSDEGWDVQQTTDNGYIITGNTESYGAGGTWGDIWLIKTNSDGSEVWNRTFGGTDPELGCCVRQTIDDGYIITGETWSIGTGVDDVWLIKTNSAGNMEWNRTFGGLDGDRGCCGQQTTDGGYIITGWTWSFSDGYEDIWLIKTDSAGNKTWDRTFGGTNRDGGEYVQQTTDGGYIITGWTKSYGAGYNDFWLIKTDEEGYVYNDNDTTPPVTTISFFPKDPTGKNGWYVDNVKIFLEADDMSGVNTTYYSINSEPWVIYYNPFVLTEDNVYNIVYFSVDIAGNMEFPKLATVKVDKTPPFINLTYKAIDDPNDGWRIYCTAYAFDQMSGMDRVEFFLDDVLQEIIYDYGPFYKWYFQHGLGTTVRADAYDIAGNMNYGEEQPTNIDNYNNQINAQYLANPLILQLMERFPLLQRLLNIWILKS